MTDAEAMKPNILFIMTDQQRFDTIAALGNKHIHTPNMDLLVHRGLAFTQAYSTCPVCVPARYTIRTGCESPTTRYFTNSGSPPAEGQAETMEGRCGPYLARRMGEFGYRTFGIGKFHSSPWNEDLGYETQLHSEELYATPEALRSAAEEIAYQLLENSPQAMALSKQAVWGAQEHGYERALIEGWELLKRHWSHPDFREGPRAFAEKRPPRWNADPNARSEESQGTDDPGGSQT